MLEKKNLTISMPKWKMISGHKHTNLKKKKKKAPFSPQDPPLIYYTDFEIENFYT